MPLAATTIGPPENGDAPSGRAFITAMGVGQICSWGSVYYSFPQLAEAVGRDLGWTKPELYGAATLGIALSGLAVYPLGLAIDRGYGRLVMGGGSVLAGLLMLALAQVESLPLFYLIYAGIGCLQAATLYEPAFAVITRRFGPANARRGIIAVTLWGGFASTVFVPLIQLLLDETGWRGTLLALGLVNIVLCGGIYFGAIRPQRDTEPEPLLTSPHSAISERGALSQAVRQPVFWALALSFTAYSATYSAFMFHLYPLLGERGLSAAGAVAVISCVGPAQVAGRVLIWAFAGHLSIRAMGAAVVGIFPAVFAAIFFLPSTVVAMAAVACLYGAANGIMTIVRGMAVPEMLIRQSYGAVNGALTAPSFMARAMAPAGAAALWAASGGYDGVLAAIVTSAVLTAISFWGAALLSLRSSSKSKAAKKAFPDRS